MREGTISTKEVLKIGTKVNSSSRYYYVDSITDDKYETIYDVFSIDFLSKFSTGTYHVVTNEEQNRIDKISFAEYGRSSFWWLIAWANKIIDPFIIKAGTTLYIPTSNEYRKFVLENK